MKQTRAVQPKRRAGEEGIGEKNITDRATNGGATGMLRIQRGASFQGRRNHRTNMGRNGKKIHEV